MVVILTETSETHTPAGAALPDEDALWLHRDDAEQATGWSLKPEGLCRGEVCVPVPRGRDAEFVRGDLVNVSAFWSHMGKPAVPSRDADVWYLGEDADTRNEELLSLEAPDFELPDLTGRLHRLTDYRRKRVLLITWASW